MIDLGIQQTGVLQTDKGYRDLFWFHCGCKLEVDRYPCFLAQTDIHGRIVKIRNEHRRVARCCSSEHAGTLASLLADPKYDATWFWDIGWGDDRGRQHNHLFKFMA